MTYNLAVENMFNAFISERIDLNLNPFEKSV